MNLVRGGIFWLATEQEGEHPVCVLTRDEAIPSLDNVVVATVSKHIWGIETEVLLGSEDGMPRECAISLDNLRTVPKGQLTEEITVLAPERVHEGRGDLSRGGGPRRAGGRQADDPARGGQAQARTRVTVRKRVDEGIDRPAEGDPSAGPGNQILPRSRNRNSPGKSVGSAPAA